jgi:hypothetical protein
VLGVHRSAVDHFEAIVALLAVGHGGVARDLL